MSSPRTDVVAAANGFSLKLYKRVRDERVPGRPNLVISPLAASVLLTLTRQGARGITKSQMDRALQIYIDNEKTAAGYKELLQELQIAERLVTLISHNWLFVRDGTKLEDNFCKVANESYFAHVKPDTFNNVWRSNTNRDVERITQGAIKDILSKVVISEATRLVMLNATFFKAGWLTPFNTAETSNEDFFLAYNNAVCVPTMHGVFTLDWGEVCGLDAEAIRLPYNGVGDAALQMIILLPKQLDGLKKLEMGLENLVLSDLTPNNGPVYVSLPRVRIECTFQIKEQLQELGIVHLFDENADLSGITNQTLYVDSFIQKTFIGLDENGTEVCAVPGTTEGNCKLSALVEHTNLMILYLQCDTITRANTSIPDCWLNFYRRLYYYYNFLAFSEKLKRHFLKESYLIF